MSRHKTTLKRLEYEAEGVKLVEQLLEANKQSSLTAAEAILAISFLQYRAYGVCYRKRSQGNPD